MSGLRSIELNRRMKCPWEVLLAKPTLPNRLPIGAPIRIIQTERGVGLCVRLAR
jgi:hypothetical protein